MSKIIPTIVLLISLNSCFTSSSHLSNDPNPKASAYNVQLGLAYLQQGDRQRAKKKLLTAMAEAPHSPDANGAMAYYFESTQDVQQADIYYRRAIQINPKEGASLNNYGAFLCRQARYDEAERYFLKAAADPKYTNIAQVYENAGFCALAAKHLKMAKHFFQQALAEDPKLARSSETLARLS